MTKKQPFSARLDPRLLQLAKRAAKRDNRSLTNWIEERIRDGLERETPRRT